MAITGRPGGIRERTRHLETAPEGFSPGFVAATLNTLIGFSECQFSQLKEVIKTKLILP